MNFEAVPCMFTGRAEDGNQAQLFGLLIRPSANATGGVSALGGTPSEVDTVPAIMAVEPKPDAASVTSTVQSVQPTIVGTTRPAAIPLVAKHLLKPSISQDNSRGSGRGGTSKKLKKLGIAAGYCAASVVPISPKITPSSSVGAVAPGWPASISRPTLMPYCEPSPSCASTSAVIGGQLLSSRWNVPMPTVIGTGTIPAELQFTNPFPTFQTHPPVLLSSHAPTLPKTVPITRTVASNVTTSVNISNNVPLSSTVVSGARRNSAAKRPKSEKTTSIMCLQSSGLNAKTTSQTIVETTNYTADFSDMPILLPANYDNTDSVFDSVTAFEHRRRSTNMVAATELSEKEEDKPSTPEADSTPPNDPEPPRRPLLSPAERHESESENISGEQRDVPPPLLSIDVASVDVSELAERLYSNIKPEQLRQLTTLIQSKALPTATYDDDAVASATVSKPEFTYDANDSLIEPTAPLTKISSADDERTAELSSAALLTDQEHTYEGKRRDDDTVKSSDLVTEIIPDVGNKPIKTRQKRRYNRQPPRSYKRDVDQKSSGNDSKLTPEVNEEKSQLCDTSNTTNYEALTRYRRNVRAMLNEKIRLLIDSLAEKFADLELRLPVVSANRYPAATWTRAVRWREMEKRVSQVRPLFWPSIGGGEPSVKKERRRRKNDAVANAVTTVPKKQSLTQVETNAKIKKRGDGYTKIRTNIALETPQPEAIIYVHCKCGVDDACLSVARCSNRAAHIECINAKLCRLSAFQCKNRQFTALNQSVADSKLRIFSVPGPSTSPQFGVRTSEPLARSQLVCEYLGEIISDTTYSKRMAKLAEKMSEFPTLSDCYAARLQQGFVLDATRKGNVARFIANSYQPNCRLQTWLVGSDKRVGVFAIRNIFSGEQLTINYAVDKFIPAGVKSDLTPFKCSCVSKCNNKSLDQMTAARAPSDSISTSISTPSVIKRRGRKRNALHASDDGNENQITDEDKVPNSRIKVRRNAGNKRVKTIADGNEKSSKVDVGSLEKRFRLKSPEMAVGTQLFLRRNVRRAKTEANALMMKRPFSRIFTQTEDGQASGMRSTALFLEKLFWDVAKFSVRCENISQKRVRQLLFEIRKYMLCNGSSTDVSRMLETFDALLTRWIDLIANSYGEKCGNAFSKHYVKAKETIAVDFHRKHAFDMPKEILNCILTFARRLRHVSVSLASPSGRSTAPPKSPTPLASKRHPSDPVSIISSTSSSGSASRMLAIAQEADLSYISSPNPIGSYNPDHSVRLTVVDEDCVRCICGIMEDDGVMTQCDKCNFWLHVDCLDVEVHPDEEFICDFCTRSLPWTPNVDIVLRPQPYIRLPGCVYYRTLVNTHGLQVRVNETVYVKRLINDEHKQSLRELHEQFDVNNTNDTSALSAVKKSPRKPAEAVKPQTPANEKPRRKRRKVESGVVADKTIVDATTSADVLPQLPACNRWHADAPTTTEEQYERKDLRTFRVERIFTGPNGERFVFGVYYARPHETFCESSRTFYRNELFWTPLFDTLPLDAVVGRCLILEPNIWAMGRPKSPKYLEEDVFICEYQIDRNQRSFEKIPPKNRYSINTEPYVFQRFETKLTLKRDFTPFILYPPSNNSSPVKTSGNSNLNECLSIVVPTSDAITKNSLRSPSLTVSLPAISTDGRAICIKLAAQQLEIVCNRLTSRTQSINRQKGSG